MPAVRPVGSPGLKPNNRWPFSGVAPRAPLKRPISELYDDFTTSGVNAARWPTVSLFTQPGDGKGHFAAPTAQGGENNLKSAFLWGIEGGSVKWKWALFPTAGNWRAYIRVYMAFNDFNNYYTFEWNSTSATILCREQTSAGGARLAASVALDTTQVWGRIRQDGLVFFEYSADGINWTELSSGSPQLNLAGSGVQFAMHYVWTSGQAVGPTGELQVDSVNIDPIVVGQSIAVGQALETDTADVIASTKALSIVEAVETDTAQAINPSRPVPVDVATETDTASAITYTRGATVGIASETDTAQATTSAKTVTTGQATETDTASGVTFSKSAAIGAVSETDTASAMTPVRAYTVNLATETDTAIGFNAPKTVNVDVASEVDTSTALATLKTLLTGQVTETDTATALASSKLLLANQALETDTATAVALIVKQKLVGFALEIDSALPISPPAPPATAPLRNLLNVGQ